MNIGRFSIISFVLGFLAVTPVFGQTPSNDQCDGAILITGTGYTNSQPTTTATSTGDPFTPCAAIGKGVWYQYTPTTNGQLFVDTIGSGFDSALAVYQGSCDALTYLACDDSSGGNNNAFISLTVTAGTTYYFLAGGYNGSSGNLVFHLNLVTHPSNDTCDGAIVITGTGYTNSQPTTIASSTGDPVTPCAAIGKGVWYQYTPVSDGQLFVDTIGSGFDSALAVYQGSCDALTYLACDDSSGGNNNAFISLTVTAGTTYYFLAGGYNGSSGNLVFHLNLATHPPNDQCDGAIVITGTGYTNSQPTTIASSTGDPVTPCAAIGKGVWYEYTPTTNGQLFVDTIGSGFDSALAVYQGSCDALTYLACDDNSGGNNNAFISLTVTAGTNYYFLAGGYNGSSGNLVFHLNLATHPPNDQCDGAIVITGTGYTNSQPTTIASSTGDQVTPCAAIGKGVWYEYTPTTNGQLFVDTIGSGFDSALAVYQGSCDALTYLACDDSSGGNNNAFISLTVTAGTNYYFLAGGYNGSSGNLVFHLNLVTHPSNDQCDGAIVITGTGYTNSQPTTIASSTGDPVTPCAGIGKGVWYQYTPASDGQLYVDTIGSSFDSALAIYTGSCDALTYLACDDSSGGNNNAFISRSVTAGTSYYFLAGGYNGSSGNLVFHLNLFPIADLSVTNLAWVGVPTAGRNLAVSWVVTNLAAGPADGTWHDTLILSMNTNVSGIVTSGTLFDSSSTHSVTLNGSYTNSLPSVAIPPVQAGDYYLIAIVDSGNNYPETDETNNLQVAHITITNIPPTVTLLTPTNQIQQTSCVPVSFSLVAQTQTGSYAITNVTFYDGSTPIAQTTTAPYHTNSVPLDHGSHVITAQALDKFGLLGTSVVTSTVSIFWPSQTNVLRADAFSNTCVICMAALNGTNYVIEAKTNLSSPAWLPIGTNQVNGAILVFTNQQTVPARFYRTQY